VEVPKVVFESQPVTKTEMKIEAAVEILLVRIETFFICLRPPYRLDERSPKTQGKLVFDDILGLYTSEFDLKLCLPGPTPTYA
jgi:hypothetical protein